MQWRVSQGRREVQVSGRIQRVHFSISFLPTHDCSHPFCGWLQSFWYLLVSVFPKTRIVRWAKKTTFPYIFPALVLWPLSYPTQRTDTLSAQLNLTAGLVNFRVKVRSGKSITCRSQVSPLSTGLQQQSNSFQALPVITSLTVRHPRLGLLTSGSY